MDSTTSTFNKLGENSRSHETILMRSVHNSVFVGGGVKPCLNKEDKQQVTSKRKIVVDLDNVSWSDLQYDSPVEEVALCLIQISEGKRRRIDSRIIEVQSEDDDEDIDEDNEDEDTNEDEDHEYINEYEEEADSKQKRKKQTKYLCDICGKTLRSYQALGGHRTSHRNKRLKIFDENQTVKVENKAVVRREYKCQVCNKVFESGQALGGHKKAHYSVI